MALLAQKVFVAVTALWGLWAVAGVNTNWHNPQPLPSSELTVAAVGEVPAPSDPPAVPVPLTTTTVTTIAGCDDVARLGVALGWPQTELATLRMIANAESGCQPWQHNLSDPHGGSYGLLQINGFWCLPSKQWPIGWLQEQGIVSTCDDLYSATANLQAGLAIWRLYGWHPWATFNG